MSFIYPRTIAITRPPESAGVGFQGYTELSPGSEDPVVSGLQASIQLAGQPGNPTGLPSGVNLNDYRIFVPRQLLAKGIVKIRDVITDDLGVRYKVIAPYWEEWAKAQGPDAVAALKQVRAAIGR